MISKIISIILVAALLHGSLTAQNQPPPPAQTIAQMQQVLHKAQEKSKAVKVTLNRKIDNRNKLTGTVSEISDTSFTIVDQKSGKTTLAYGDVRQVSLKGMSTGAKVAIGVGVALAALIAVAVAACYAAGPCRD